MHKTDHVPLVLRSLETPAPQGLNIVEWSRRWRVQSHMPLCRHCALAPAQHCCKRAVKCIGVGGMGVSSSASVQALPCLSTALA